MKINSLYLPGFSHRLCGRRPQPEAEKLREKADRLNGLATLVAKFIPKQVFGLDEAERERIYTPWATFVAFLGQVLTRNSSCREAVRQVQAWRMTSHRSVPNDKTSAYCQARGRLSLRRLRDACPAPIRNRSRRQLESVFGFRGRLLLGNGLRS